MKKAIPTALAALALACGATPGHAASIYISPATQTVNLSARQASFELLMDFATSEATIGGGIDIDFTGPVTYAAFTPSSFFTGSADPAFSGFGTARADNDVEVHFGNFSGLSGQNSLGTLTLNLAGTGVATVALAVNRYWGDFYSLSSNKMTVEMRGGNIVVVPEPQTVMLMLAGLGVIGGIARRSRPSA